MKKKNKFISGIIIFFVVILCIFFIKLNIDQIKKEIVSIYPEKIYKGDPIFVVINSSSTAIKAYYDKKAVEMFTYNKTDLLIIPTDFYEKENKHNLDVYFSTGMIQNKTITLNNREKIEKPLGIPEKLGGNTPQAARALVNNLSNENYILNNIKSDKKQYWEKSFSKPLKNLIMTDGYGYNRNTVGQTIVHKGTDFKASIGDSVYAMNDGLVKISENFKTYGNTIVIDHGLGLLTLYMHLSDVKVKKGDIVKRGDIIGLSGDTGYVTGPHLHISIKINGISIDPATFMKFFKVI